MTTSNHIYTGAAIALLMPRPLFALPLALVSHFVLDALPHYGYGPGGYGDAVKHRLTFAMESINIVGIPLLAVLLWGRPWWAWAAALLAIVPDFVWIYRYFWYERPGWPLSEGLITHFHHKIQWCERKWGILVEVPFFGGLVWLVAELTH